MRLEELMEDKTPDGTYAGVRFDDDTKKAINDYISDNNIPNGVANSKLHTTLLYSRKYLPDYKAQGDIEPPFEGTPTKLEVWQSQPDEDGNKSNCLIMTYDCPDLIQRHKELMDEHKASYDYDEYKPHVTLSYDIGDMDIKELPDISKAIKKVGINKEYQEDLNLSWAKDNSTKK